MGSVNVPGNVVVNGANVLTPGPPCSTCDVFFADPSFQVIFSDPKNPTGPGYTVLYTGGTAELAALTCGFHRTGLPFEAGTYIQFPVAISPTQSGKDQYMFGQIYDQNTGQLYIINDFDTSGPLDPPTTMTPDEARSAGLLTTDMMLKYPMLNGVTGIVTGSFTKIMKYLRLLYPWMKAHPWLAVSLFLLIFVVITLVLCVSGLFCLFNIMGAWNNVQVTDSPFPEGDSRWPTCMTYKMPDGTTYHMKDPQGNLEKTGGPTTETWGTTALKVGLGVGGALILAGIGVAIMKHKPKGGYEPSTPAAPSKPDTKTIFSTEEGLLYKYNELGERVYFEVGRRP